MNDYRLPSYKKPMYYTLFLVITKFDLSLIFWGLAVSMQRTPKKKNQKQKFVFVRSHPNETIKQNIYLNVYDMIIIPHRLLFGWHVNPKLYEKKNRKRQKKKNYRILENPEMICEFLSFVAFSVSISL